MPRDSESESSSGDEYESARPLSSKKKGKASMVHHEYRIKHALKPPRTTTYTAQALFDQIIDNVIDLAPGYQRDVVWQDAKQIGLIDSIFRNFYIPPLIFAVSMAEDGSEKRSCIDGKQRLTSIHRFMLGEIFHRDIEDKTKYYYKDTEKGSYQLPDKYKRLFANKQIVCIEYSNLTDDDEREIFRRVQMGVALTAAEKMKAGQKTQRQELVTELVANHVVNFESVGFNTKRDAAFRWTAQSFLMLTKWPHVTIATTYIQLSKWLDDPAPVSIALSEDIHETMALLVEVVTADRSCLEVSKGPTTIAPVDLVMMILLIGRLKGVVKKEKLGRAIKMMRAEVRAKIADLMWKSAIIEIYVLFIQRLEREGEQMLGSGEEAEMEVDPPTQSYSHTGNKNGLSKSSNNSSSIPANIVQPTPSKSSRPLSHDPPPQSQPTSRLAKIREAKGVGHGSPIPPSQSFPSQSSARSSSPAPPQPWSQSQPNSTQRQHPAQSQPLHSSFANDADISMLDSLISEAGGVPPRPQVWSPPLSASSSATYGPTRADHPAGNGSARGSVERSSRERDERFHPYAGATQDPRRGGGSGAGARRG